MLTVNVYGSAAHGVTVSLTYGRQCEGTSRYARFVLGTDPDQDLRQAMRELGAMLIDLADTHSRERPATAVGG